MHSCGAGTALAGACCPTPSFPIPPAHSWSAGRWRPCCARGSTARAAPAAMFYATASASGGRRVGPRCRSAACLHNPGAAAGCLEVLHGRRLQHACRARLGVSCCCRCCCFRAHRCARRAFPSMVPRPAAAGGRNVLGMATAEASHHNSTTASLCSPAWQVAGLAHAQHCFLALTVQPHLGVFAAVGTCA